jgi:hypothetical protein
MFVSEKKLSVQIAEVDCVEVDNMNFGETAEDDVLEQFATNASGADHEHFGLSETSQRKSSL